MCVQYPIWLFSVMLFMYVQVFSERLSDGLVCLYDWHHLCFYVSLTLYFCYKVFMFQIVFGMFRHDISVFSKRSAF